MKRVLLSLCYVIPTLLVILLVYRVIFGIEYSVILATLVIVCTFPFMMWLCRCGQDEIKKQERMIVSTGNHSASDRRMLVLCIMCMSPVYWALLIVAMMPIVKPGMFFMTMLPAIGLSFIPAKILCDTYHSFTHKRVIFLAVHLIFATALMFVGQIPIQLLFA